MPELRRDDVDDALRRAVRDLGPSAGQLGPVGVRRIPPTDRPEHPGDAHWLQGLPEGSTRWVLTVGDAETALDEDTREDLAVSIASHLQDEVIDATGRPWPEVPGAGVLDARLVDGVGSWCGRDGAVAPIGDLRGHLPSRPG